MPSAEEPDVRFTLANERTFLAYERTAIGLLVAAVGVLHLLAGSWAERVLGFGLLAASGLTALMGWRRFREADAAIRNGEPLPTGPGVPVVVVSILVLVVLVGLSVLV